MAADRKLRWQNAAVRDLESSHTYLLQFSPEAARRFAVTIMEAAEQLLAFPEMGPVAEDLHPPGRYRSLVRGSHRLVYRIDEEVIWLLRVWDTRQDPGSLQIEDTA